MPPSLAISVPRPPPPITVPTERPNLVLHTSMGSITLELYWHHAPLTCYNLHTLSSRRFFHSTPIHRVARDFVLQAGDPTGTGRGGDSCWGGPFADELHPGLHHTGAGVLSMANAGPNTNRSQFFITLGPARHLDGKHAVFGRVREGMTVVQKMGMVPVGAGDKPIDPITIYSMDPCD